MGKGTAALIALLGITAGLSGQDIPLETSFETPVFDARFGVGFNYDLLRPPTQVSFDYPKGFVGVNVPFQQKVNLLDLARMSGSGVDDLFNDSTKFQNPGEFQPMASAQQNPNATVRVDVPMLGGVGSFSNIQNMSLKYLNALGFPGVKMDTTMEDEGLSMLMRASVYVPLDIQASWETLTFGYAYKVNKQLMVALNLHRHVFMLDMRANVDANVLGYVRVDQDILKTEVPVKYSVGGSARAHYLAEVWSPTIALKYWRLGLTSRFGVKTRAKGRLKATYVLPFFIDEYTFAMDDLTTKLMDPAYINQLQQGTVDSVNHITDEEMVWRLPDGHTFSFDIVPEKLTLSYTKTVGDLYLSLGDVWVVKNTRGSQSAGSETTTIDTVDLEIGSTVDHVFLLSGDFRHFFFNMGAFTLDMATARRSNVLGESLGEAGYPLLGGAPVLPVLNFGSALGSRMQLMLELDILPLLAVKSGVVYYF